MSTKTLHIGRSWSGTEIEDECPCPQVLCGLVDVSATNEECEHHPVDRVKTMRQAHYSDQCPGRG